MSKPLAHCIYIECWARRISATRTPLSLPWSLLLLPRTCLRIHLCVCTMNILSSFIIGLSILCNTQTVHKTYTQCVSGWTVLDLTGINWPNTCEYCEKRTVSPVFFLSFSLWLVCCLFVSSKIICSQWENDETKFNRHIEWFWTHYQQQSYQKKKTIHSFGAQQERKIKIKNDEQKKTWTKPSKLQNECLLAHCEIPFKWCVYRNDAERQRRPTQIRTDKKKLYISIDEIEKRVNLIVFEAINVHTRT